MAIERDPRLIPVSKEPGGPFFGYADQKQIDAGLVFTADAPIPDEEPEPNDTPSEEADDDVPPPKPKPRRRARNHPAS